jgi:hypothetical protein
MTPPAPRSEARRTGLSLAGGLLAALAFVALGVAWHRDRARVWEPPRWDPARFEVLRDSVAPSEPCVETWAVVVNPLCPHCRASLERAIAARARPRAAPPLRLAVLLVDTPRRPEAALAAGFRVDQVWWDARAVWRRRWGHRVYGEVLCFDPAGRPLRTLAPLADSVSAARALELVGALAPQDDL